MPLELFLSLGTLRNSLWRDEFPRFEQQARYEPPTEAFGGSGSWAFEFAFQSAPPLPRIWLISESGNDLLQVQADWFAANWRAQVQGEHNPVVASYPRWRARRQAFAKHWATVSKWMEEHGHAVVPSQCEVTYINHIRPIGGVWGTHAEIESVLPGVRIPSASGTLPEQISWRSQSLIPPSEEVPEGRLHVSVTPGFVGPGPEPAPILVLELTVRGAPPSDGDLLGFLNRGRKTIVETFLSITSDAAREAWGQQ